MGLFFQRAGICERCSLHNDWPTLRHPKMDGDGYPDADILILGEAPGEDEDQRGRPFMGASGSYLRTVIERSMPPGLRIRYTNTVRCRPTKDGKNRTPTKDEVYCCSSFLEQEIQKVRPLVVIGTGDVPLHRIDPSLGSISTLRGIPFPASMGGVSFWYYPVFHPAYIIRKGRNESAAETVFRTDLVRIGKLVESGVLDTPQPLPLPYNKGIRTYRSISPDVFREELNVLFDHAEMDRQTIAVDIETDGLDPFTSKQGVLTMAFGYEKETIAVSINHPESPNPDLLPVIQEVLGQREWAHHDLFELYWFCFLFGEDWLYQAFYDDQGNNRIFDIKVLLRFMFHRSGVLDLGTATRLLLGVNIKNITGLDASAPWQNYRLSEWLEYNGHDARFESMLLDRCMSSHFVHPDMAADTSTDNWPDSQPEGVWDQWEHVWKTIDIGLVVTLMRYRGLRVDPDEANLLLKKYSDRIIEIEKTLYALPEIQRAEQLMGRRFKINSSVDVKFVLKDVLGFSITRHAKHSSEDDSESTDAEMLESLLESGSDVPRMLLDYRENFKVLSTYVKPIATGKITVDNVIHSEYSTVSVITGRRSSKKPNMQNVPKRNPQHMKDIRSCFVAPEGHVFLSMDYGQLEARIIGMASRDPNLVKFQREDYDIHSFFRDAFIEMHPKIVNKYREELKTDDKKEILKAMRTDIKANFVFASLYGSTNSSCAEKLNLPEQTVQPLTDLFWETFPGVLEYRQKIWSFYRKYGYVRNLYGRRRGGILSDNEQINFPIQSTAADLCRDALTRLMDYAFKNRKPWLVPNIEIHDDIETIVPEDKLEEAIKDQSGIMLSMDYEWIIVPLVVESACGKVWGQLEDLKEKGKFRGNYRTQESAHRI